MMVLIISLLLNLIGATSLMSEGLALKASLTIVRDKLDNEEYFKKRLSSFMLQSFSVAMMIFAFASAFYVISTFAE